MPPSEINDQPPPTHNQSKPIWELVVEDMKQRDQVGRERYGTPLQAHNGRDALIDAYQEALDQCVYLRQAIEECKQGADITPRVEPFLYPEDIDRKLNWPLGTTSRLARRKKLPHYCLPDGTLRFVWREISALVVHVQEETPQAIEERKSC